jgi:hypothetical protein
MNKKTEKILVGIGLGLLGIFGVYKLVKAYKKGMEEIENQEFLETEELENAGVNTSKLKSEISEDEKDFTRMLYVATRFNSDIDLDLLDIDGVIDNLDHKVIHVRQRFDTKTKHNESRRRLDFLIDIPDYTSESFRGPKIGNFLTTFKDAAIYMSDELVKFSHPATRKLIGSVVISRKINGEEKIEYRELVPEVYKAFADEEHDGLTKFYETEKRKLNHTGPFDYIKEADWLFENYPDLSREEEGLLIENILLQYQISFPIRSNRPDELYGIDTKSGVECIKYLTEKLYVGREDSRNKVEYRNLMFNAPNEEGIPDLSWYYTTDDDDKVIIDNIIGFEDE